MSQHLRKGRQRWDGSRQCEDDRNDEPKQQGQLGQPLPVLHDNACVHGDGVHDGVHDACVHGACVHDACVHDACVHGEGVHGDGVHGDDDVHDDGVHVFQRESRPAPSYPAPLLRGDPFDCE